MEFSITPSYSELFGSECSEPQELISDLKSEHVISYLALINTQLYMADEEDPKFQKQLLSQMLFYWLPEVREEFINSISNFASKNSNLNFFKSIYVTHFMHNELLNYRTEGKKELKSKDELNIVRAYFAYIDKFNRNFNLDLTGILPDDRFAFQKSFWPVMARQFDFNEKIDPIYQHLRIALVLEHFYLDNNYREFVEKYLVICGKEAIWNLVMDMMSVIMVGLNKRTDGSDLYNFFIRDTPGYTAFLENYSIDVSEYKSNLKLQEDFLGIRQKPLLKVDDDKYAVLSWKFLYNSVYLGTLFDFKNRSGIESKINYNTLKSIIGTEVSEKVIFKKIVEYIFRNHHAIIHFDDNSNRGLPDVYIRLGKYVLLIEFKDYLMPTKVISSNSYDAIKKHLDECFVLAQSGQKKGITQLFEQILTLEAGGFSFDKYEDRKIKKRNLVVMPIIVTTTFHYEMPGINSYLAEELNCKVKDYSGTLKFGKIVPLTMIDFGFLYRQFNRIGKKEVDLKALIFNYHKKIKNSKHPFDRHKSFESSLPKDITNKDKSSQRKVITICAPFGDTSCH